ncbi:zinc-binding protein A33-like isoform X1 [Scyliorhinus canicula]|uniref:zinc-binding protein A33-like isoform X1 n=1 Tax=Scyliorhinus canicula TaxID=7830 RepID=UPI0018F52EB2|nr:zinc-binding protein A33-like isoform X1 [Scyliorhinus canicula]
MRTSADYDNRPLADDKLSIGKFKGPLRYTAWREMMDVIYPAAASLTQGLNTANRWLLVSEDQTSVRHGNKPQELPDTPVRFDRCVYVLGEKGFTSERHYWEVKMRNKTCWALGLDRRSADRKGRIDPKPQTGYWTIIEPLAQFSMSFFSEKATSPPAPTPTPASPRACVPGCLECSWTMRPGRYHFTVRTPCPTSTLTSTLSLRNSSRSSFWHRTMAG